jgi:hypothetical protein
MPTDKEHCRIAVLDDYQNVNRVRATQLAHEKKI